MTPRISFVVPVRNDARRLDRCLRSILAGSHAAAIVEIVVVDNGSVDDSAEVARQLGARVLVIEQGRVSELRNRGADQASGEILAFVDADNEIGCGWIDAALANLQTAGTGATGALYLAPRDGTWVQRAYGLLRGQTRQHGDVEWLGSGNLAVWRHVFERVGGFDVSLEACEDVDLCRRMRGVGVRLLGDPRLESIHHGDPRTLGDLFESEMWRGRDNLRVSLRRPIDWSGMPSAVLPIVDAALLASSGLGLLAWLVGWTTGLGPTAVALALMLPGSGVKVMRAVSREPAIGMLDAARTLVAACVYDLARAIALFRRAPHRNARVSAATTTAS